MAPTKLSPTLSVSAQTQMADIAGLAAAGYRSVISNRPDGEEPGQPSAAEIQKAAEAVGLRFIHIPIRPGTFEEADIQRFLKATLDMDAPILAFCRTGTRSTTLWALSQAGTMPASAILAAAAGAGYDLSKFRNRLEASEPQLPLEKTGNPDRSNAKYDIVIVGGGAAGVATAASLLRRNPALNVAIIEPRPDHDYQPGWTMVGAGIFDQRSMRRAELSVIPAQAHWIKAAVSAFQPVENSVRLDTGDDIQYRVLVVAPGIMLDWAAIPGLTDTIGQNGVTSNYRYETAPYTWKLTQELREGIALFTQPPMPIKCAGAPQKAMYLSCDHWRRHGYLDRIEVAFHNANASLFGVAEYVPPLMQYIGTYGIDLQLESKLIAVDGPSRTAIFKSVAGEIAQRFDMLHVCPPQKAPPFLADSPLANEAGYVEVDPITLQHVRFPNIFGLGDAASTTNAKTAAAARQQAPVVAVNALAALSNKAPIAGYNGYGSCPLTVERGKIVLAEFGYGGKLLPTFPRWLIAGEKPQRLSWLIKSVGLPFIYWNAMLKGREWFAAPQSHASVQAGL